MAHTLKLNFNEAGTSETWNNVNYNVIPTGFLTDVTLTKISSVEVSISAFTAYIKDNTKELSIRIENTAVEAGIAGRFLGGKLPLLPPSRLSNAGSAEASMMYCFSAPKFIPGIWAS